MKEKINYVTSVQEIENILRQYIKSTDSCEIHTSLSAFGYIPGGEQAIVTMLKNVLCNGNIMMPAQTNDLTDPSEWGNPAVTLSAQEKIRKYILPFDLEKSSIQMIGRTPEYFRTSKGVKRSNHPLYSVCVWGKDAKIICKKRTFDMPFGKNSPLYDLYKLNAKIIMLGTDYESCTALHLADSTINRPMLEEKAPIRGRDGKTKWITFKNVDELDKYDDFNEFGKYFEKKYSDSIVKVPIYKGYIRIIPMKLLVDTARDYYQVKDQEHKN
ncbi:AAC(3) family N-acetyltransferase [Lactobacillus taiwanensis]|uniref:AAC(3) family N-acetyltransferase n=1 Tax=Lactobacillus taiwanensis TaxID=508451 RepID=UPI000B991B56|nr:AAC(3) family N-acetyltransferase [Lactobacillus taiwanensis]OYR94733.1 AAC(3) family N-acetyltransferase [Lactobacillus taiwanensis]OYR99769.1 AAC(3) family N-acetyltransferase [Lactobacillus taiwanensis]OYS12916.1 AAC(3) family N-acetyltransferase [Lactobacillus taiwanensis]OYS30361.1 AAC(3) family N-acetyltransferase [Lactobacillus taiwanensis]OYS31498.1 AAC(3) family N-acetyltransferase [Lactobacillus taiwanensis]